MSDFSIGRLAEETGVKIPTIRYYEDIGLLPPPERSAANRRLYPPSAIRRLCFIRHARELGFEIDAIRQLLALSDQPDRSCDEVDALARTHLAAIESRLERLSSLREEMQRMIHGSAHGRIDQCRVIEILADHDHCLHQHH